jgi:hypothetical protein
LIGLALLNFGPDISISIRNMFVYECSTASRAQQIQIDAPKAVESVCMRIALPQKIHHSLLTSGIAHSRRAALLVFGRIGSDRTEWIRFRDHRNAAVHTVLQLLSLVASPVIFSDWNHRDRSSDLIHMLAPYSRCSDSRWWKPVGRLTRQSAGRGITMAGKP